MIGVFEYMEDFDNAELSPYERQEQLEEAVRDYNEENSTSFSPSLTFNQYERWQHNRSDK